MCQFEEHNGGDVPGYYIMCMSRFSKFPNNTHFNQLH